MKKHVLRLGAIALSAMMAMGSFFWTPQKNKVLADGPISCNDTAAIQAALNSAEAGAVVEIEIPHSGGPFFASETITVPSGKTLKWGEGWFYFSSVEKAFVLEDGAGYIQTGGQVWSTSSEATLIYGEGNNSIQILSGSELQSGGTGINFSGELKMNGTMACDNSCVIMRNAGDKLTSSGSFSKNSRIEFPSSEEQEVYGAIHMIGAGCITLEGGSFANNWTNMGGAAIHADAGTINIQNDANDKVIFSDNTDSGARGGAVYLGEAATLSARSPIEAKNNVSENGGFVYVSAGAECMIRDSEFSGNGGSTTKKGGAVFSAGTFVCSDSSFTSNRATAENGDGGAIYSTGQLGLNGVTITQNSSSGKAGGVFVASDLRVEGAVNITDNRGESSNPHNLFLAKPDDGEEPLIDVVDNLESAKIGVTFDSYPLNDELKVFTIGQRGITDEVFSCDEKPENKTYRIVVVDDETAIQLSENDIVDPMPSWSIDISGDITLICKVELPEAYRSEDTWLEFYLNTRDYKIRYTSGTNVVGRFKVQIPELMDGVEVKLRLGDGTVIPLQNGNNNISVRDVMYAIKNGYEASHENENYPGWPLFVAMLNYGGYAQYYFGHNASAFTAETVRKNPKTIPAVSSEYDPRMVNISEGETNLSYYASTVLLWSSTSIRHYFFVEDGNIQNYHFYMDGEELEVHPAPGTQRFFYVDLGAIDVLNFSTQYEVIAMKDKREVLSVKYSIINYFQKMGSSENDYLMGLARAGYSFYTEAVKLSNSELML